MPKLAVLMAAEIHNGDIELYALPPREVAAIPVINTLLRGKSIPSVALPESDCVNRVVRVVYDMDEDVSTIIIEGLARPSDDAQSVLAELHVLDKAWEHVPPNQHGLGRQRLSQAGEAEAS